MQANLEEKGTKNCTNHSKNQFSVSY